MRRSSLMLLLCLGLSGCGAINSFLAAKVADVVPAWAGGLPADAPPRPGEPGYAQFEQQLQADLAAPKSKKGKDEQPVEAPAGIPVDAR